MTPGPVVRGIWRAAALLLLIGVAAAAAAADSGGATSLRIGLVLDDTYVNDPFEHGAYVGLRKAIRELGVKGKVVVPKPGVEGYVSPFTYLARQRYDLIIGLGFFQAGALDQVALRFPRQTFALVDSSLNELRDRPRNVLGTRFATQEGAYLAGYLAVLLADQRRGRHVVASVGGVKIPPVDAYIAGYQAGARAANPHVEVLNGYSNSFDVTSKCRAIALGQIASGASAIFQVADACGLGALAAARERGVWGIGVDVDESHLGPQILTSVVKRVDVAVFDIISSFRRHRLRTGTDAVFDLANGGVALGKISPKVPPAFVRRLDPIRAAIVAGRIKVPARL